MFVLDCTYYSKSFNNPSFRVSNKRENNNLIMGKNRFPVLSLDIQKIVICWNKIWVDYFQVNLIFDVSAAKAKHSDTHIFEREMISVKPWKKGFSSFMFQTNFRITEEIIEDSICKLHMHCLINRFLYLSYLYKDVEAYYLIYFLRIRNLQREKDEIMFLSDS